MKVYVLETGCYEQAGISGVYATPEAAMAAWQPKPSRSPVTIHPPRVVYDSTTERTTTVTEVESRRHTYAWSHTESGWSFDADWEDAASITEYEVQA